MLLTRNYTADVFANVRVIRKPLWLIKILNYEYWPLWVFYAPLIPYIIWLIIKYRNLKFYEAANPSIEAGGLRGESKKGILDKIDSAYKAKTILINKAEEPESIFQKVEAAQLAYPLIAKPDAGEQGKGVEKINNAEALLNYLRKTEIDFLIQEFVHYPIELGVFYVRYPGEPKGKVTSVTAKKFLSVTGNGYSTTEELILENDRARFQLLRLREKLKERINYVPVNGEEILLEGIGNHCLGTKFINASNLINQNLDDVFDKIATPIEGFYFGRFDLRVSSIEDLYNGENIRIVELNGVGAIPAHIFDSSYKLFDAYRDVINHWKMAANIAERNRVSERNTEIGLSLA
ncbi:MAG: hypothetical protein ABI723_07845 [Bacteroidia bacterium]